MARLVVEGASERDVMLKKEDENEKVGNEAKWEKNNERKMLQQMSNLETNAEKRVNAKKEKSYPIAAATNSATNSATVNASATSSYRSNVENEKNHRKTEKYSIIKSITLFPKYIYHDGYICNRTLGAWIITILYLLCIYIFLTSLVTAGIYIMLYTTRNAPVYYGETTFIGGIPGIGFEPRKRSMKKEQNIFKWNTNDPKSYTFYVRRLRRILYEYAEMEIISNKFKIDCKRTIIPYIGGKPIKHFCTTDVTNTDETYGYDACALTKTTNFGYDIGTPCIMLRINKLFGYYPERPTYNLFTNNSLDFETVSICGQIPNTTICCNDDRMLFHCTTMDEHTNITIRQYPKFGYPYCFYPFNKQNGYMQPFIMVQLFNLIPNKKIGIKCTPTAPDLRERSLKLWFEIISKRKN